MTVIQDQRQILRPSLRTQLGTRDDVEQLWKSKADSGFLRDGEIVFTLLRDTRTLDAYINQGRWVADCPACNAGIACWPANPHGACLGCGRIYKIGFPASSSVGKLETVLAKRPMKNRNWRPGKTASQLRDENARRGVK